MHDLKVSTKNPHFDKPQKTNTALFLLMVFMNGESFMDEMATIAGMDPLDFRLVHLENGRLRDVLVATAEQFDWSRRFKQRDSDVGVGLACGTEKGSYVAACVEIAIDRSQKEVVVRQVCEVFECGAVINRDNLLAQVEGCIVMGMGPALRER